MTKKESLPSADFINDKNYKFSVLMSVYYKENPNYLDQALNSVFNQTLVPDELVLVEDGKLTEDLNTIISKYKSKYNKILKLLKYENNRGLGVALHDGLLECTNEIVFRMDSDDVCDKNRFEKQLKVFCEKKVDIVGSNISEYDENMEKFISYRIVPETDKNIKKYLKKRNPMNHVTVAYKKEKVLQSGNYMNMPYFEDYYLWARMIKNGCKFYNIQESLVNVRGGNEMIKRRGGKKYIKPIINFEKKLLGLQIINIFQYCVNVSERIVVSLIPNSFRLWVYKKKLRK